MNIPMDTHQAQFLITIEFLSNSYCVVELVLHNMCLNNMPVAHLNV